MTYKKIASKIIKHKGVLQGTKERNEGIVRSCRRQIEPVAFPPLIL